MFSTYETRKCYMIKHSKINGFKLIQVCNLKNLEFREKPKNPLFGVNILIFNRCQKFRNNSSNGICFSYVYIRMYTRVSLARVRHSNINIDTFSITIGIIEIRNNNLRLRASSNGICVFTFKFGRLPVPQTGKHPHINVKTQIPLELDLVEG